MIRSLEHGPPHITRLKQPRKLIGKPLRVIGSFIFAGSAHKNVPVCFEPRPMVKGELLRPIGPCSISPRAFERLNQPAERFIFLAPIKKKARGPFVFVKGFGRRAVLIAALARRAKTVRRYGKASAVAAHRPAQLKERAHAERECRFRAYSL